MATAVGYNTYAPDSRGPLHVQIEGTWYRLPKVRNVGFTATTPTDTTTEYVDEPTETRSGSSGPGSVTYDLTRAPTMLAYKTVYEAFKDGTSMSFRDFGGNPTRFVNPSTATGNTIALAAPGNSDDLTTTATLVGVSAGTKDAPSDMFRPGKLIRLGRQMYTIEEVLTSTTLTVSNYGTVSTPVDGIATVTQDDDDLAVVAASAVWSTHEPGTLREFSGRITEMGAYTRGASNEGQVDRMVVNVLSFPTDSLIVDDS